MARTADARYMLFSRDPHLAAVGMYWMPLPVIGQLPFMLILSPLHHAGLSGPLATAFAGALSVFVLTRICQFVGLSRVVTISFVAVFALNPIMVWSAANGMSEEWSYLGCLIALLGYIRWCKEHRSLDLGILASGLVCVMLTRYEGLALAPIMGVAAALNDGRCSDSLRTVKERVPHWLRIFGIAVLPTFYTFALWTICQYVIERDPFYWLKQSKLTGQTSSGDVNLPSHLTLGSILVFAVTTTIVVCPALCVIAPLLVIRRRLRWALQGLGIVVAALLWPAIVAVGLLARESTGTTRYFEPAIVFMVVGAIWLAGSVSARSKATRRFVAAGLIAALGVSVVISTAGVLNPKRSSQEHENLVIDELISGESKPLPADAQPIPLAIWRSLVRDLDQKLGRGHKVLIDASVDFEAFVFTRHPDSYIVDSDRDYLPILSDPSGKFDYIIVSTDPSKLGPRSSAFHTIIGDATGGHWAKWRTYSTAVVYHFVPSFAGP